MPDHGRELRSLHETDDAEVSLFLTVSAIEGDGRRTKDAEMLEQRLVRYEEGGDKEFPAFAQEVEAFVAGYWDHMRKEEERVFPLAEKLLKQEDWASIDRAFEQNRDPLAAERETRDFQKLFTRIVDLAPPPIGVGPSA